MLVKPRPISPGVNPEPGNGKMDLGAVPLTSFEFSNKSPYFVYVRFDYQEQLLDADPHVLIDPWSQQSYSYGAGTTRLVYMAAKDLEAAPNPNNVAPMFWFNATDRSIQASVPAFQSVGITEQPVQELTGVSADVSRVVDDDFDVIRATLTGRFSADPFARIQIRNDGTVLRGNGSAAPTLIDINAGDRMQKVTYQSGIATTSNGSITTVTHNRNIPVGDQLINGIWRPDTAGAVWSILGGVVNNNAVPFIDTLTANSFKVNNFRASPIDWQIMIIDVR